MPASRTLWRELYNVALQAAAYAAIFFVLNFLQQDAVCAGNASTAA